MSNHKQTAGRRPATPLSDSGGNQLGSGNVHQTQFSQLILYPFSARLRMNELMKDREAKLKNFKVVEPIFPERDALIKWESWDAIKDCFESTGLGFVVEKHPEIFECMVCEFA